MSLALTQFAAASTTSGDIFSALGIDWKTLILQIIAFVILVWLLGKFVYPWLVKSVDARQAMIEAATTAAKEAQSSAEATEKKIAALLHEARGEASDIIATAKLEAATALTDAEEKARTRTDQIVADAQAEIAKDIIAAKTVLHNETLALVSLATEKVLGKTITKEIDQRVIVQSLEESR